jgi:hypothetical protein
MHAAIQIFQLRAAFHIHFLDQLSIGSAANFQHQFVNRLQNIPRDDQAENAANDDAAEAEAIHRQTHEAIGLLNLFFRDIDGMELEVCAPAD